MRICVLTGTYPCTTETFVYEEVRWLTQAGHTVCVIAEQRGDVVGAAPTEYPVSLWRPWVTRTQKLARMIRSPVRVLAGRIPARDLTGSSAFTLAEALALSAIPEIRRANVVLAQFGPIGAQWLPVIAGAQQRYAVYMHGFDATSFVRQWPNAYDGLIESRTAILTNGTYMKGCLAAAGFDPDRIGVVPYGVSDMIGLPGDRDRAWSNRTILSIARLVPKKGLDDSIRAFALAQDRLCGRWRYRIVGEGPLERELHGFAHAVGVGHLVDFSGFLSRVDTLDALRDASIFILASRTAPSGDTEGTPVSIIEAGTLGIPIIATDHAGIPQLVPDTARAEGMMVDERDVDGLACALRGLAGDEARWRRWGEACAAFARSRHSAAGHVRDLVATLDELAAVPRVLSSSATR